MNLVRLRRPTVAAAAIVALGGVGLTSGVAVAGSARPERAAVLPRWRIVGTTPGELTSVVAPSAGTQWAFGARYSSKPESPIALRHSGSRWIRVAMPSAASGVIACASASSPRDIWAFDGELFGPVAPDATAALRLRNGHWSVSQSFGSGLFVTDCHALSPTNVWAFGSTGAGPSIGTWHLQKSSWTQMNTYPANFLGQASVISPGNIWATGWDGIEGLLAHWNGSTWTTDPSLLTALPTPSSTVEVQVRMVNAIRSSDLWVEALVGRKGKHGWRFGPQVMHWNGHAWSAVSKSQFGYYLPVAVRDGRGGWWSTGYPAESARTPSMTYLLHGAGGSWTKVALPAVPAGDYLQVSEPASVPGTRTSYAVGNVIKRTTGLGHGVILKIVY
jgi:hypothetical protein